jgi:hypothetical protein
MEHPKKTEEHLMKYFVQLKIDAQVGNDLENSPGGPGPIIGRVLERFKPEAVYMACSERALLLFVDLPTEADVTELMVAASNLSLSYPTFTPVVSGKDFPALVERILPAAQKLVKG